MTGIYSIRQGDKFYVGQAVDIKRRWNRHRNSLRSGTHSNPHLQNAWNKHGEDSFHFEIIEICESDVLLEREEYWISSLDAVQAGFNCKVASTTWIGKQHRDETRKKISESHKGKLMTPDHCAKISAAKKGKKQNLTDEQRSIISERMKGNKHTLGYSPPQEVRDKISQANKGKKRSAESLENYRNAHANRTDEEKQRISEMNAERARKRWEDPEQREKMINAIKEGKRRRKEQRQLNSPDMQSHVPEP